ncbi:MAG: ABC transporter ATP-binding protein [Bacillota bacterium]|jgi:ABC-type lipoprotein export system ATPase subunit
MNILTLQDVSYIYKNKYQKVRAVKDISYAFQLGKVYAIVGKSGSGKTTLLSLLAGLDLPSTGHVVYGDTPTQKLDRNRYRREDVAVIYQAYNLFPLLTALENVMYPLELQGMKAKEAKVRAAEMIRSVDLTDAVFKRFPSMLSGGEQQRIAIARALAAEPKVILADEPTGNLDTENGANIVNLLISLAHEKNCCVIIVTHDPSIANQADVVLRMRDGEVIEDSISASIS